MKIQTELQKSFKKNKKLAVLVFCAALVLSSIAAYFQVMYRYEQEREHIESVANGRAIRAGLVVADLRQKMQLINILILQQNGGTDHVGDFARTVMAEDASVESIQLAPNGVLGQIYPQGADRLPARADLFSGMIWTDAAKWSRNSDCMAFVFMEDGRESILKPVFLPNAAGDRRFWGFIIFHLARNNTFTQLAEDGASEQLACVVYARNAWNDREILAEQSAAPLLDHPVEVLKSGDGGVARFLMTPADRWIDPMLLTVDVVLGILFSVLVTLVALLFHDQNERRRAFEALSFRDVLTGLYNRRKFEITLEQACQVGQPFMLCYIDFDRFKAVNDTYGHDIGDLLLQAGAQRLRSCVSGKDKMFRIGGDEFVAFIASEENEERRETRAAAMRQSMREPFHLHAITLQMDISVGYVMYPRDAESSEKLIRMADKRMYEEKQRHKLQDPLETGGQDDAQNQ